MGGAVEGLEAIGRSEIHEQLCEMMRLNMEIDDLYEKHASKSSVSPTAFWLLYALVENRGGQPLTQRRFCKEWSYSPQTVNSCLKKLQRDGFVSLVSLPDSRKEKGYRAHRLRRRGGPSFGWSPYGGRGPRLRLHFPRGPFGHLARSARLPGSSGRGDKGSRGLASPAVFRKVFHVSY